MISNQNLQSGLSPTLGQFPGGSPEIVVTPKIIAMLKKEVDFNLRVDLQQADRLADATYRLSLSAVEATARALGIRAKAQVLHAQSRHAEAIEYYTQAREIYQSHEQPIEAARVGRSMVDALMYQGKYEEALELAAHSRQVFESYGEKVLAAQLETNVGNIHHRLDRYQEALACYDRAAETFRVVNDRVALAMVAYNVANIYCCIDDFRKAETAYRQSQDLFIEQGMELAAAQSRYALGYLYFLVGDFHQAVRELHEVRVELQRLGKQSWTALCDLDLAEIYLQLNVAKEAAEMASRATVAFLSLGMEYEAAKALSLFGLASFKMGNHREAQQQLAQAREKFVREGNDVYRGLIDLYLADIALAEEQPHIAMDLASESELIFWRDKLKTKTIHARIIRVKALLQSGKYEEARNLIEAIIQNNDTLDVPWLEFQGRELFGDLLLESADSAGAYREYSQAVAQIEKIRGGIRVDEYRSAFFTDKLRVYEKLIRLCLDEQDGSRHEEALFYLESSKARTLIDQVVGQMESLSMNLNDISPELIERWRRIREELNWYYNKVGRHESSTESRRLIPSPGDWEEIRCRERALADVIREIQISDPHFVWLKEPVGITVGELQARLAPDEMIVEYHLDENELRIFAVDRDGLRVTRSAIERPTLKAQVMKLKLQLGKFQYGSEYLALHSNRLLKSVKICLYDLYQSLIAPVASQLRGKRLIFVPYDFLHNVPFQALFDGQHYLLDRYEIGYAPSGRLFSMFASATLHQNGKVLLVGAADEHTPKIDEEIRAIKALYPDAACYTGAEATTSSLSQNAPGKKIVHLASHAVFRHDNPMFSAFQMADTWLNFYDISALDLRGSLVTLSGCSTGANQVYAGDELIGMARGFLSAGAASLIVSLWEVNDNVTASLMSAFYKELQAGAPPRRALRAAELQIKEQHPHPYYWAPFLFMGGPRQD